MPLAISNTNAILLDSAINNPNISEEGKKSAQEKLDDM